MKKILYFSMITLFFASTAFAQKGVVKDAERALKDDKLKEARTLIKQAQENPETATDPKTWKIAGDIGNKAFDNERTKQMLGKKTNNKTMYDGLLESYAPYVKADELGEVPNKKGKVKNRVRKDIQGILKANHPFYINGGVYYNEEQDYGKAADFFEAYWNIPTLPMFADKKDEFNIDSTYQTIKYYAVITAIQAKDHKRALKMLERASKEPFIENSAYKESDIYELMASEYMQLSDTAKYTEALYAGAEKFPKSKYFIPNLVNLFIRNGENQKALDYLDKAIANDPSNACDLNSVKAALFAEKNEFDKAEEEYKRALMQDAGCERALEGLAVNYILQAQNLKDKTAQMTDRKQQAENDKKTVEFYKQALPHIEKYTQTLKARSADSKDIKSALIKLQNVYYNLSNFGVDKSKELETCEAELEALK